MEQRVYQGNVAPQDLADYLVQHYDPQDNLQAQKIGQGDSLVVQIGRGDEPENLRNAVSVAITRAPDAAPALLVTMGEQQWITPQLATHGVFFGLIGALVTPWALLGLIWPISQAIGATMLPADIWNTIGTYMASRAATLVRTQEIEHPGPTGALPGQPQ